MSPCGSISLLFRHYQELIHVLIQVEEVVYGQNSFIKRITLFSSSLQRFKKEICGGESGN